MHDAVLTSERGFAREALAKIAEAEGSTAEERLVLLTSVIVDILKRIEDDAAQDIA